MFYVQGISNGVLAPGQLLTIWGGCFDDGCQVLFGGSAGVMDSVEDGALVAVCPEFLGEYTVEVKKGSAVVSAGSLRVVNLSDTPLPGRPRDYSMDDFVSYVRGLFPRGNVLDLSQHSNFGKFIWGLAYSVNYLWGKIKDLFADLDPAHVSSFAEWEADLGLPVEGIAVDGSAVRLAEIYRAACSKGGCTKPFMLKMLRLLGYEADIYEYYKDPAGFSITTLEYSEDGNSSESKTYSFEFPAGADKKFYWLIRLHVSDVSISYATCDSDCDSYLVDWMDRAVESVINSIKPAHTAVGFVYDDGVRSGYLLDEDGKRLVDENGKPLTYTNHLW